MTDFGSIWNNTWTVTIVGTLIATIIASLIVAIILEKRKSRRQFRITKAIYGKNDRTLNITAALNAKIVNGKLDTELSNEIAGDPLPGVSKIGKIHYRVNGKHYDREYTEGELIHLP